MPLDRNKHEDDNGSFKMMSGSEYNLSSPLSFFPHPQLQQCLNTSLGKLALNNRAIGGKLNSEREHQQRLHSESVLVHSSLQGII